jgi:hypothetical protein
MSGQERETAPDLQQRQIDELRERVTQNRVDIDSLRERANAAEHRADASDERADAAEHRADASDERADAADRRADASEALSADDRRRIGDLESHVDIDRAMLLELQADGLISQKYAAELEKALHTSRRIGAAIGIVMASRGVSETEAFLILTRASQHTNRKVRVLADDVVLTGDVRDLPGV